jgi:hypothetical protein
MGNTVAWDRARSKVLGSVVGAAIGDALGAPLELWKPAQIAKHPKGTDWIEGLVPWAAREPHPHGVWRADAPLGTATDDTRLNQVLVEAGIKYGRTLNSRLLATEYVDRYLNYQRYYPGYGELARQQFMLFSSIACGALEMESSVFPGVPPHVLRSALHGRDEPTLAGLYNMRAAGLFRYGDPEEAYKCAFELNFLDMGYGRDAMAMLAAMIAAGFDGSLSPREAIRRGMETDPYRFHDWAPGPWTGPWTPRTMVTRLERFISLAEGPTSDRELVVALSREVRSLPRWSPIDALGVPVAAAYRAAGDPKRALLIAVNDRYLDDQDQFAGFRDIDCTGTVCGALCGALTGIEAFPREWIDPVVEANRDVYGFDVWDSAERLFMGLQPHSGAAQGT